MSNHKWCLLNGKCGGNDAFLTSTSGLDVLEYKKNSRKVVPSSKNAKSFEVA